MLQLADGDVITSVMLSAHNAIVTYIIVCVPILTFIFSSQQGESSQTPSHSDKERPTDSSAAVSQAHYVNTHAKGSVKLHVS